MQNILVQKFGGTSVANLTLLHQAVKKVSLALEKQFSVVVVLSAMGEETDELLSIAHEISSTPNARELDMLLATGEQKSTALFAMLLNEKGIDAVSLTGWQAAITTSDQAGKAKIEDIDPKRIKHHLKQGQVVVVTGFQGITNHEEITTLGRGGSDLSAVALAGALNAKECRIYTDVDGICQADPRIVPGSTKYETISYEQMLELSSLGAKVLHRRAVELAVKLGVSLRVLSSFDEGSGTLLIEEAAWQKEKVASVATHKGQAMLEIKLQDKQAFSQCMHALTEQGINMPLLTQTRLPCGSMVFAVAISSVDLPLAKQVVSHNVHCSSAITVEQNLAVISLVGVGIRSCPKVNQKFFELLLEQEAEVYMLMSSEIRLSALIPEIKLAQCIRSLHQEFCLDEQAMHSSIASLV